MHWRYGAYCAPAGILVGTYIISTAIGSGYEVFLYFAPLAAFLCGALFWRIFMREATYSRAVCTGGFAGLFSHWVCWYLLLSVSYLHELFRGVENSNHINLLVAIPASAVYSFFSILFFGWFTAGFAIILAMAMTWNIKRKFSASQALSE